MAEDETLTQALKRIDHKLSNIEQKTEKQLVQLRRELGDLRKELYDQPRQRQTELDNLYQRIMEMVEHNLSGIRENINLIHSQQNDHADRLERKIDNMVSILENDTQNGPQL